MTLQPTKQLTTFPSTDDAFKQQVMRAKYQKAVWTSVLRVNQLFLFKFCFTCGIFFAQLCFCSRLLVTELKPLVKT